MLNQKLKFLVPATILTLFLGACAQGEPEISIDTTEFDFGDVNIGEIVTRDLIVNNIGASTLVVDSLSTSCGCTTAELDQMQIAAGESTTLHITFDGGAHGDVTGFYTRQVFIDSNDPENPEIRVQFTANVIRGSGD